MTIRIFLLAFSFLSVFTLCAPARALDQVPLAPVSITPVEAQIAEFASAELNSQYAKNCESILKTGRILSSDQKVLANKTYRKCKAEAAMHNLSVWSWQDARR